MMLCGSPLECAHHVNGLAALLRELRFLANADTVLAGRGAAAGQREINDGFRNRWR
jgi:hypothetical protein